MILTIGETKKNRHRAFTLIEILLVIIIMGIALALAAPNFSRGYAQFQLNKTADDLLMISRWAQAMAIEQERSYALSFSEDRRSYGLVRRVVTDGSEAQDTYEPVHGALGRRHDIPNGISVTVEADHDPIEFYPDGTIDPVVIRFNFAKQKITLSSSEVNGLMTKVSDE